jgi:hypothetical protein
VWRAAFRLMRTMFCHFADMPVHTSIAVFFADGT